MKQQQKLSLLTALFLISGCASVRTITDTVTLYPTNKAAQKWGELSFYTQYKSSQKPGELNIDLPNNKSIKGQLLFIDKYGQTEKKGGFWDKVSVGVGVGVGTGSGNHGGFGSVGVGTGDNRRTSSKFDVTLNAFGDNIALDCKGDFNSQKNNGTLTCRFTNGMEYRGVLKRIVVK